ncbi:hypothetical protein QJQ45_027293, partial [Haematococcus lacustris]
RQQQQQQQQQQQPASAPPPPAQVFARWYPCAPELFFGASSYGFAIDIWAAGLHSSRWAAWGACPPALARCSAGMRPAGSSLVDWVVEVACVALGGALGGLLPAVKEPEQPQGRSGAGGSGGTQVDVIAELLLRRPWLPGTSDIDQLGKIFKALGTPTEECWPGRPSFVATAPLQLLQQRPAAKHLWRCYPGLKQSATMARKRDWATGKRQPAMATLDQDRGPVSKRRAGSRIAWMGPSCGGKFSPPVGAVVRS